MSLTNIARPTAATLANVARVVNYETWATITTTWATETRTWLAMASEMENTARVTGSLVNTAKP